MITLSEGVPVETVSRMLGHEHIKTTQRYAELSVDKIREDMKTLSERIARKFTLVEGVLPTSRKAANRVKENKETSTGRSIANQ